MSGKTRTPPDTPLTRSDLDRALDILAARPTAPTPLDPQSQDLLISVRDLLANPDVQRHLAFTPGAGGTPQSNSAGAPDAQTGPNPDMAAALSALARLAVHVVDRDTATGAATSAAAPRTLDPKLLVTPPPFSGDPAARDRSAFCEWRIKVERYLRITGGGAFDYDTLSLLFSSTAFSKLQELRRLHPTWSEATSFLDAIEHQFIESPDVYAARIRAELRDAHSRRMKPSQSVQEYDNSFHALLGQLPPDDRPSDKDLLDCYKAALRPDLRKAAFATGAPRTLAEAKVRLEIAELEYPPSGTTPLPGNPARAKSSKPLSVKAVRASLTAANVPPDVVELCAAALSTRPPTHAAATTAGPAGSGRPARLTSEERERLMRQGACLRCRQLGHLARDCPVQWPASAQRPAQNPQPLGTQAPVAPPAPIAQAPNPRPPSSSASSAQRYRLNHIAPATQPSANPEDTAAATPQDEPDTSTFSDVGSSVSHQDLVDFGVAFAAFRAAQKN